MPKNNKNNLKPFKFLKNSYLIFYLNMEEIKEMGNISPVGEYCTNSIQLVTEGFTIDLQNFCSLALVSLGMVQYSFYVLPFHLPEWKKGCFGKIDLKFEVGR